MSLSLDRLENVRHRVDAFEARCPACAELGRDKAGVHLWIKANGQFGCAAFPGDNEHRKRVFELAGVKSEARPATRSLPTLRDLTFREVARIAEARKFQLMAGIEIARQRGLVHACDLRDGPGDPVPCWAVGDSAGKVVQARRMDGRPFAHRWDADARIWKPCTPFKAKTIGLAGWPVGAAEIGDRSCVLITEGGPDLLAGHLIAWWFGVAADTAIVAMLGAGQSIPKDAAPYFRGKRCRILIDNDAAGESAANRWAAQLFEADAADVSGFRWHGCMTMDGATVKDASDFASTLDPEIETAVNPLVGLAAEPLEVPA